MNWIDLKEKKPDVPEVRILLADGSEVECLAQLDGDFWWKGGGAEVFICEHTVTHWQPSQIQQIQYFGDDTSNTCDEKTAIDRHNNQWVGLTLDEKHYLNDVLNLQGRFPVIEAIESKLKYKNSARQKGE